VRHVRALILLCFVLTLAAGIAAGLTASRAQQKAPAAVIATPAPADPQASSIQDYLSRQLGTTPQQSEQLMQVWSPYMAEYRSAREKRRAIEREKEEAFRALLTPEQQIPAYEKLQREFDARKDEASKARREHFAGAVERSRAILTPDQQSKFDQMLLRIPDGRAEAAAPATQPANR
jgi:hypothetical protein